MADKAILMGMNNPYGGNPKFALYPRPRHSAGGRLYQMLHEAAPALTMTDYIEGFDRRNLLVGEWDNGRARAAAGELLEELGGRRVVLLGTAVMSAFETHSWTRPPWPIMQIGSWMSQPGLATRGTGQYTLLPHPSGRNPVYNDPRVRREVGALLAALIIPA